MKSRRRRYLEATLLLVLVACLMLVLRPIFQEQARLEAERQARAQAMMDNATAAASKVARVGPLTVGVAYSAMIGDLPGTMHRMSLLEAEQLSEKLAKDPNNTDLLYKRVRQSRMAGDKRGELADLNRLLELSPEHGDYLFDRAKVLTDLGRFEEAYADIELVLQLDKGDWYSRRRLAEIEIGLGRNQQALESYKSIVEWQGSEDEELLWGQAAALRGLGREQEALALFKKARESDPTYCHHWNKSDDPGYHEGPCQAPF